jgi:hypothetical protein
VTGIHVGLGLGYDSSDCVTEVTAPQYQFQVSSFVVTKY